ncbi:MAG TPA: hypothetical protein VFA27_04780 [Vicinamibacterales bacterium]|nr:hypothetical protein [Vicinamibacterales bacterium]
MWALGALTLLAASASAQTTASPTEHLAFDRPEAWAQEYFTSVSFLTGPAADAPGSVCVQLEGGWTATRCWRSSGIES